MRNIDRNSKRSNCVAIKADCAEIAILGVGPAALSAAIVLRQSGISVTVIGKARRGQFGIGESIPGATRRIVQRLGLGEVEAFLGAGNVQRCTSNLSLWGNESWEVQDSIRNPEGGGWHILRRDFEQRLLQFATRAGVDIRQARLSELQDDGATYRIHAKTPTGRAIIDAPFIIDATGRQAWLVRRLAGIPKSYSQQFAVIAWMNSSEEDVEDSTRIKAVENGWWYTAKLPKRARVVGFHGLPDTVQAYYKDANHFLSALSNVQLLPEGCEPLDIIAPLQTSDASVKLAPKIAGPRWLAIGDAAQSFDPLSAQGLYFSFYSAINGAEAAIKTLSQPGKAKEILADYCRKIADVFQTNQRARSLFYAQETRFPNSPYWQTQKDWEFRFAEAI